MCTYGHMRLPGCGLMHSYLTQYDIFVQKLGVCKHLLMTNLTNWCTICVCNQMVTLCMNFSQSFGMDLRQIIFLKAHPVCGMFVLPSLFYFCAFTSFPLCRIKVWSFISTPCLSLAFSLSLSPLRPPFLSSFPYIVFCHPSQLSSHETPSSVLYLLVSLSSLP